MPVQYRAGFVFGCLNCAKPLLELVDHSFLDGRPVIDPETKTEKSVFKSLVDAWPVPDVGKFFRCPHCAFYTGPFDGYIKPLGMRGVTYV